ncbi:MAG: serine/threonine protein kinase, partial [Planctomycetes bacterium]|nr:serine/threonine protein kinase [Planctomycetota bacterium]
MAGAAQDSQPKRIAGYAVEGILGAGGTSRVYLARQEALDRRVALKVFKVQAGAGGSAAGRLAREARLLARLDHENIVRCFDFGQEGESFYLAMELVEGESLKQRLDRQGRLAEEEAVALTTAVARALQHAHSQGIVHRDVKPGNVLLAQDGRVKLTDFGLARGSEDLELTLPGTLVGTPQYLSPEQARNPRRVDERTDLYSLGACLYHMVTGVTPHRGETLAEVIGNIVFSRVQPPETHNPDLSQPLSRVIARLMARERQLRYQSARELLEELGRLRAPAGE